MDSRRTECLPKHLPKTSRDLEEQVKQDKSMSAGPNVPGDFLQATSFEESLLSPAPIRIMSFPKAHNRNRQFYSPDVISELRISSISLGDYTQNT